MAFFTYYTHLSGPHWAGLPRWGTIMIFPITVLFIVIWALFIADQARSRQLWDIYVKGQGAALWGDPQPYSYTPAIRWGGLMPNGGSFFAARASIALLPDPIHLPIHHYLICKDKMHPITTLSTSAFFALLWVISGGMFFVLVGEWSGSWIEDTWYALCFIGVAFQFVLAGFYAIYMGFTAVAVHRWRKNKKRVSVEEKIVDDVYENGEVEVNEKDGQIQHAEVDGSPVSELGTFGGFEELPAYDRVVGDAKRLSKGTLVEKSMDEKSTSNTGKIKRNEVGS